VKFELRRWAVSLMSWNITSARLYRIVAPFRMVASHAGSFDVPATEIMVFPVVDLRSHCDCKAQGLVNTFSIS
jgi:hypothetical protein